ncbi:MAG: hypothetical protein Ct9H300mP18_04790 [Candidatus Neomarinimicrobiota bacterium]|nr:MAG: hypothetical protein Ct9H300mP18_04790 [Candidatus Neomarinimicrobiota bacterium]
MFHRTHFSPGPFFSYCAPMLIHFFHWAVDRVRFSSIDIASISYNVPDIIATE